MAREKTRAGIALRGIGRGALGVGLVVTALLALSYSSIVRHLARRILLPEPAKDVLRVARVDETNGTVTMTADPDSIVDGRYGLWFDSDTGYALLGDVVRRWTERDTPLVERSVTEVKSGKLQAGQRARLGGWYYRNPSDLALESHDVLVETPLGPAPAWLVPAAETHSEHGRWAIHIHGRGAARSECLRGLPVFRAAGFTSLVVSYRNDHEAPPSIDGRYGLGATEWRDVEAALRFARRRGATSVVLVGWSMGGAIALQALDRSPLARELVTSLVLDSPVVDWRVTLRYQARVRGVPSWVTPCALWLVQSPWSRFVTGQAYPVALDRLDFVARAGDLAVPTLILHSDNDGFVPPDASIALAERRPDIVTLVRDTVARHTRIWNVDPAQWESAVGEWLARNT